MASKITFVNILVTLFCVVHAEQKRTLSETLFAKKYLKQYHYLSPIKSGNHDWKTAVEIYQRFMNLPVTGNLDDVTYHEMEKPRCGVPDLEEDEDSGSKTSSGIRKRFGVSATPWPITALTYAIENYGDLRQGKMSQADYDRVIAKAFKMWADNSVLTFKQVMNATNADIKIAFGKGTHANCNFPFDGPGNVLAHAQFPTDGRLHFDDEETFTDGTSSGKNLLSIAVHEIGHVIGISHTTEVTSIMYPEYKGYKANFMLTADDINAAAYLYGGGTVKPKVIQSGKCADLWGSCGSYKDWCSKNANAMRKNCAKTCGFCGGQIRQCVDVYPKNMCQAYLKMKLCSHAVINKNCFHTCNPSC